MTTRGLTYPGPETLQFIIINQFIHPSPLSVHRWEVWAPRRDRVHPQRGRPRVRERDRRGRRGSTKAADRPDQTSRRRPQSLQLESPSFPTPARPCDRPFKKKPATHLPLSLVCALTESVGAPHFSSTTSKNKFKKKHTPTNIAQRRCLWASVATEWGGSWTGMDENHTHTHHIQQTDGVGSDGGGGARLRPHSPPSFSVKRGGDICPDVVGTCHLPHIHPLLVLHCSSLAVPLPLASQLLVWSQRHF